MTFAKKIIEFNNSLHLESNIKDIEVMNPFSEKETRLLSESFYKKYFSDNLKRTYIFGINPGRFGGGITGVPFTDPVRLEKNCSINNDLQKRAELSSLFIYDLIDAFGGAKKFYNRFFITAVVPLGFTRHNKNLNYYDDKDLLNQIKDYAVKKIKEQIEFGTNTEKCFCLGEGTNFKIFSKWNDEFNFFKEIIPLPHPRWIMQYRLKRKQEFIELYLKKLRVE